MKKEDIREIQELIKSKGLENEYMFKDVISYDTTVIDKQTEYYQNVKGKYFKEVHDSYVEYHYVHDVIKQFTNWTGKEELLVKEDNYSIRFSKDFVQYHEDLSHHVSNTLVDRYNDCKEITKEEFDTDMAKISKFKDYSKNLISELSK